ncbi:MAG: hypothetical protein ACXVLQ_16340 [Bacteriovorax sp.]
MPKRRSLIILLIMKKLFLAFGLCFSLLFSSSVYALDPKVKILGTMAGYGVVGGALLGTATMAFGSGPRAIAKGASLGLYAGLLFGGYIVLSYEMKKRGFNDQKEDYYPDSRSPYEDNQTSIKLQDLNDYGLAALENKKDPRKDPLFAMNLLKLEF